MNDASSDRDPVAGGFLAATGEPEEAARPRGRGRAVGRRVLGAAVVVLAAAGAAGLLALLVGTVRERAVADAPAAPPRPVTVSVAALGEPAPFVLPERYAGRVEPRRESRLSFERAGTLEAVLVEEGERVEAGAVLARLDTRGLEAERRELRARRTATEARRELADLTLTRARQLLDRGHATDERFDAARLELARLEASLEEIDAGLERIAIALDKSAIRAPFAGRVAARLADEGAILSAGAPVVELLEGGARRLRVGLPEARRQDVAPGAAVPVETATGTLAGTVVAVRPDIDPATQTLTVIVALPETADVPFGAIARLVLDRPLGTAGHQVPVAALKEAERGLWSLATVRPPEGEGQAPRAGLELVEVIAVDNATAFVRGTLAAGDRIIVEGRHRVTRGAPVRPVPADAEARPPVEVGPAPATSAAL